MKLGSLFDGSGGFPLAGSLCGIEPVWAAEVEPYPIAVTSSRFPNVKHLGSVTDIQGGKVEPVDIITFGSPCQDLSVAGKRAGLKHEANGDEETTRSGLFMEAVRIIKEMREATNGRYPTFAVWENVPGAFSSNKGEDFRIVLEELIKVVEPRAVMPAVPKNGWAYADSYRGDGWSLSYRVLDAQYWGVPQRRRRIYLVADFGGERARKILFEREGLRGHLAESGETRQGSAAHAEGSIGADDLEGAVGLDGYNFTTTGEVSATLGVNCGMSTGRNGVIEAIPYTLKIRSGCEGGGKGALIQEDLSATLATNNDQYLFQPVGINGDVAGTLDASYYKGCGMRQGVEREVVVHLASGKEAVGTLMANAGTKLWLGNQEAFSGDYHIIEEHDTPKVRYIVRRLTPTECARLQGFPDTWGHPDHKEDFTDEEWTFWAGVRNTHAAINGKATKSYTREQMVKWYNGLHTDSAEYKMWGNGIALPCARYVMEGIAETERGELMA